MNEQKPKIISISLYNAIAIAVLLILTNALVAVAISMQVHNKYDDHTEQSTIHLDNKLLVHVSSGLDNPHAVMMGINKALKASEAGTKVMIFFDVKATDVVLDNTDITFADFPSSKALISQLIKNGVEVYVCPHCLMVNGNKMSEVQSGVKELTMESMMMFASGGVTTLDY